MSRLARIGLLISVVSLAAVPVLGRGGGGHGGGGHCGSGGAHGGGSGHGGSHAAGFSHGPFAHGVGHRGLPCGNSGHFGIGMSNFGWDYLNRISPTPGPRDSAAGDLTESDPRWSGQPSAAEEDAQYRYDHRSGAD